MSTHHGGSRGVIGQRSLGLEATDLQTLAEKLGAAVGIHNGDQDNNTSHYCSEANEAILG
jgi:hypothetical protein